MVPLRHHTETAAVLVLSVFLTAAVGAGAAPSLFRFNNAADRFSAAQGTASLKYFDPDTTSWGPDSTQFGKASSFGLPAMAGEDPEVMFFPKCTPRQGYLLKPQVPPNGAFQDSPGLTSNYTLIYDLYYPAESGGKWRALLQTDVANAGNPDDAYDGEFFL